MNKRFIKQLKIYKDILKNTDDNINKLCVKANLEREKIRDLFKEEIINEKILNKTKWLFYYHGNNYILNSEDRLQDNKIIQMIEDEKLGNIVLSKNIIIGYNSFNFYIQGFKSYNELIDFIKDFGLEVDFSNTEEKIKLLQDELKSIKKYMKYKKKKS